MAFLDRLRVWLSGNLAPVIFLFAYFITVVLGNIIYWLPFGRLLLERDSYTAKILGFETLFTPGYWLLLFLPFFITPTVVFLVRRMFGTAIEKMSGRFFDFSKAEYSVVAILSYAFVLYSLVRADAFSLFLAGTDSISSVEARFQIREQLGFAPLAVLMSVLHYLSIYSLVRWMLEKGRFWLVATIVNAVLMSVFLTLLNMKWPILIFYAGLVLAVFVYAKRYAYLKTMAGGILLIIMYFLVSAFVFRLVPPVTAVEKIAAAQAELIESVPSTGSGKILSLDQSVKEVVEDRGGKTPNVDTSHEIKNSPGVVDNIINVGDAAVQNAPMLLFNVVNRMAIIYPYYYQVFTLEGAVCGGVLAQAKIGQPCRPSTYVYSRIFNDQFKGRGTAPAAVHISAYALGGWPVALFGLLCASIILGVFASLPLRASATVGSLAVTGAIVGYHFSQLPGEGPILYDHGFIWTLVVLILFGSWRMLRNRIAQKKRNFGVL